MITTLSFDTINKSLLERLKASIIQALETEGDIFGDPIITVQGWVDLDSDERWPNHNTHETK